MGAGYNRKVQSPPLGLDGVGVGNNRQPLPKVQWSQATSHVSMQPPGFYVLRHSNLAQSAGGKFKMSLISAVDFFSI